MRMKYPAECAQIKAHARFLSQMAQQELKGVIQNLEYWHVGLEGEGCDTGDKTLNNALQLLLSFL